MKSSLIKFGVLALGVGALTSCATNSNIDHMFGFRGSGHLLMPTGAPTLALFHEVATNEEVETTSTTSEVREMFLTEDYRYLVFDSTQALSLINNEENPSEYRFLKLLTGGNFHLVGINKQDGDLPTEDDYIIGFGAETSVPIRTYNTLYENAPMDHIFTNGVSDLQNYLVAIDQEGKVASQQIDWIFIAQPALFALTNRVEHFSTIATVDINIREAFEEKFDVPYIPQAGLFVHNRYYINNRDAVDNYVRYVEMELHAALNDPTYVRDTMNSYSDDLTTQQNRYGFNANIAYALQSSSNQFGIVDPSVDYDETDIEEFLDLLVDVPQETPSEEGESEEVTE